MRTRRVLMQDDCQTANPSPPQALLDAYQVRAQMLAPIVRDGRVVGWLSFHSRDPRRWTGPTSGRPARPPPTSPTGSISSPPTWRWLIAESPSLAAEAVSADLGRPGRRDPP
ncbi:GAF domain-containing protein [Streptomyces sp. NPDC058424]|uniref:GAF domain-containing protein n=1 Tax=Streptomyces sp. NPDC058424 TaxID=3346491 RepID=UPI00364CD67F